MKHVKVVWVKQFHQMNKKNLVKFWLQQLPDSVNQEEEKSRNYSNSQERNKNSVSEENMLSPIIETEIESPKTKTNKSSYLVKLGL